MFGKCRENAAIPNPIPRTQDGDAPKNGGLADCIDTNYAQKCLIYDK